jgi:hypothetical protein
MALTRAQAKEITTKAEFDLVEGSFSPAVTRLSPARLKQQADRARRLEDKYRDLFREQSRKGKEQGRRGSAARTERKAQLFAEVRERFEKRLAASRNETG